MSFVKTETFSEMATASLFFPRNLGKLHSFLFFCSFLLCLSVTATDTLLPGQDISGNKTLISPNQVFELGFFKTGGSSSANYYLGIWFRDDPYQKSIWVANREYPIPDSSGVLTIRYDGNLVINDRRLIPVLVNPVLLANSNGTHATLLDSGNFVLVYGESKSVVWESFFYPSDTLLPGMRLGWFNLGTDKLRDQFLVSWQTPSVPSTGSFALGLNKNNRTELRVWHTEVSREIGYWDGRRFKFLYNSSLDDYNFSYVNSSDEIYFTFANRRNDSISWFVLTPLGEIQAFTMIGKEISMVYSPICENISSSGATNCFIEQPLSCGNGNNFSKIEGAMLNPTAFNESDHLGISDCEIMCRTNCSCTGFASYRDDGTGCVFYYEDISSIADHIGQGNATIFIRGNATKTADQDPRRSGSGKKRLLWVIGIISVVILVIFVAMFISRGKCSTWLAAWKENWTSTNRSLELFLQQLGSARGSSNSTSRLDSVRKRDHELPILSFSCVTTSTNNFSPANKLGEGGFGPVYKGTLLGHEFAVKRLSRKSGQGIEEFKNEVQLISKLQHRNLVKLLGCCIEREEKILIYEYMANKSLDSFLFDPNKKQLLDLRKRVSIIEGIAQGLLYLHKYSRLRIIHRDLKTSNILLDDDMNPKISDFGMARIFGENEVRGRTNKVVGTYGYMSPEYAVHGHFSTMSDVFSFGVIMLEIVSGRRNTTFSSLDHSLNLLGYAWELWCSSRGIELIDPVVADTSSVSKLLLCLHIALLCVQERPENRPSMSDIVTVLSNENADLPPPKKPAFSAHIESCNSLHQQDCSTNDVSYSVLEAR